MHQANVDKNRFIFEGYFFLYILLCLVSMQFLPHQELSSVPDKRGY